MFYMRTKFFLHVEVAMGAAEKRRDKRVHEIRQLHRTSDRLLIYLGVYFNFLSNASGSMYRQTPAAFTNASHCFIFDKAIGRPVRLPSNQRADPSPSPEPDQLSSIKQPWVWLGMTRHQMEL